MKRKEKVQRQVIRKIQDKNQVLSHWKNNLSSLIEGGEVPDPAEIVEMLEDDTKNKRKRTKKFKTLNQASSFKILGES